VDATRWNTNSFISQGFLDLKCKKFFLRSEEDDYFLWGFIKSQVMATASTRGDIKARIE